MDDIIRVGIVSTLNPKNGTAQVYYPDRGSTTAPLQMFAFGAEYCPPEIGAQVIVAHLSNDTSSGVILGRFWGDADPPPENVEYRKDMGAGCYEALKKGKFTLSSPEITLAGTAGSITLADIIKLQGRVEALERRD